LAPPSPRTASHASKFHFQQAKKLGVSRGDMMRAVKTAQSVNETPANRPRGLFVTPFVNWLIKPFSMALIAWLFLRYAFAAWIPPADADQYIAGCIILAAAPCTAMVFVRS
jgi:ACR3 family arsenite transporter